MTFFHSRRNDWTVDSFHIYYSSVISFHPSSFTEGRQPPIKNRHFISLCVANHLSHIHTVNAAHVHFNYNIRERGLTFLSLSLAASPPDVDRGGSFSPADSSHIRGANGLSNGDDRVSNWCHLACETWWMLLPTQAEQGTGRGVRGDIWLLASGRLINWRHAETKGTQQTLPTEIWAPDFIWRHLGRIYSSISQHHVLKFLFKSVLSPSLSVTSLCVALEDTLVIILYVSHPLSLSVPLYLSLSPCLCVSLAQVIRTSSYNRKQRNLLWTPWLCEHITSLRESLFTSNLWVD